MGLAGAKIFPYVLYFDIAMLYVCVYIYIYMYIYIYTCIIYWISIQNTNIYIYIYKYPRVIIKHGWLENGPQKFVIFLARNLHS